MEENPWEQNAIFQASVNSLTSVRFLTALAAKASPFNYQFLFQILATVTQTTLNPMF